MITSSGVFYPNNVINLVKSRMSIIDGDVVVVSRRLRTDDGVQCIGVYPLRRENDETSYEIGNNFGPTVEKYCIGIQMAVINADAEQGQADHTEMQHLVDDILYNDGDFQLTLRTLTTVSAQGVRRRFLSSGIEKVNYLQTDYAGNWYYLATQEFYIKTEKSYF